MLCRDLHDELVHVSGNMKATPSYSASLTPALTGMLRQRGDAIDDSVANIQSGDKKPVSKCTTFQYVWTRSRLRELVVGLVCAIQGQVEQNPLSLTRRDPANLYRYSDLPKTQGKAVAADDRLGHVVHTEHED